MFKLLSTVVLTLFVSACSTLNTYDKPRNLLFINNDLNTYPIHVKRDAKLCKDEEKNKQNCPIKLFIDDFKSGEFYINNTATYYLKPNEYEVTIKNCNTKCDSYQTKVIISETNSYNQNYILTLDNKNKPIIIIDKNN